MDELDEFDAFATYTTHFASPREASSRDGSDLGANSASTASGDSGSAFASAFAFVGGGVHAGGVAAGWGCMNFFIASRYCSICPGTIPASAAGVAAAAVDADAAVVPGGFVVGLNPPNAPAPPMGAAVAGEGSNLGGGAACAGGCDDAALGALGACAAACAAAVAAAA